MINNVFLLLALLFVFSTDTLSAAKQIQSADLNAGILSTKDYTEYNKSIGYGDILNKIKSFGHKKPQPAPKPPIEKPDNTKEFRDMWNETISKIKYKNTHLNVNFDKYKVGSDPQNDLSRFLSFNYQKLQILKSELKVSKNTFMIKPFISWINAKEKISYSKPSDKLDSDVLMQYVSKIVRPDKFFSRNTIDTVVQLNEFCYYFERNKDRFYREGYTRNVKSCGKIEKILSANGINPEELNKLMKDNKIVLLNVNNPTQPQKGVYEWRASKNGETISIYIGQAGRQKSDFKKGTLKRGLEELEKGGVVSSTKGKTIDTRFVVGTAIEFFISKGYTVYWEHLDNNPDKELEHIKTKKPILQYEDSKRVTDRIKKIFKMKENSGYWNRDKKNEAEKKLMEELEVSYSELLKIEP